MQNKVVLSLALFTVFVLGSSRPSFANTGYDQTIIIWQKVLAQVSPYRLALQNMYSEVESQLGSDKSRLAVAFAKRLSHEYPGSYYYGGSSGQLAINGYTKMGFDSQWNVTILSQRFGSLVKVYNFRQNTLEISNGPNKISLHLDPQSPGRSRFTQATIPALTVTAKNVWDRKGSRESYPSPLRNILNDVYAYRLAGENNVRMDELAEDMINKESTRQYVLAAAEELYRRGIVRPTSKKISPIKVASGSLSRQALPSSNPFTFLIWFVGLGVVVILLFRVATNTARRGTGVPVGAWDKSFDLAKQGGEADEVSFESRQTLYSPAEQAFYAALQQVIDHDFFIVNGKTRLADLIQVDKQLRDENWWVQFNRISRKHVDFVLLEKFTSRFIGVIELDDSSHQLPDRQERDRFVDSALEGASIPILHYPCKQDYILSDIEKALSETFAIRSKKYEF